MEENSGLHFKRKRKIITSLTISGMMRRDESLGAQRPKRDDNRSIVVLVTPARTYQLDKDRVVLGSMVSADVQLGGDGVAPIHAVLEVDRCGKPGTGKAVIYDLASESGVFVNGNKIIAQPIHPGDILHIGMHRIEFRLEKLKQMTQKPRIQDNVREAEGRKLFGNPDEDITPLLLEEDRGIEEIFDYQQTFVPALEIVMSWNGAILDVAHFIDEAEILIGSTKRSHFGIPPVLSQPDFPVVTRVGESFTLNLDPKMKGVMQRKGELKSLDQVREGVLSGPQGAQIPITQDDFAKISIGDIDFYFSFTSAPPRLKTRRMFEKDPLFLKIFFSSLIFTSVAVMSLMNMRVERVIEPEQMPDRIATILYQPEKYVYKPPARGVVEVREEASPPPPRPVPVVKLDIRPKSQDPNRPIPNEMQMNQNQRRKTRSQGQDEAKEGRGARARGEEGSRGNRRARPGREQQDRAFRPAPQGGAGRGAGDSQVQGEGNVDFLKSAGGKIQDLLGNSAAHLGKGGERLKGFGGFTTQGNGGLALSGTGRGGGGDAESLGGLSDRGRGGGRVGTGLGAAGSGSGIIGGKTRIAIRTGGPEEAVVMGMIDADAVEAALLAHRDEFRLCYEREINAENPDLAGRVGTSFVIGSTGNVTHAGIESTTLKHPPTERCVLNVIRRIHFPIPRGAGTVQVTYPFKFTPVGR